MIRYSILCIAPVRSSSDNKNAGRETAFLRFSDALAMEGKRIQFGRTQGWLIFSLGFILIAAQVVLSFHLLPENVQGATSPDASTAAQNSNYSMFFIPGILGMITIGVGCYFLLQDKFKTSNPNPPAKTKSGFPM